MKFSDENDVRKWLRSIPLKKKELMLKIDFYAELRAALEARRAKLGAAGVSEKERDGRVALRAANAEFYAEQTEKLRGELDSALLEFERLTESLEGIEKNIITMRCLRRMSWTAIGMQTSYSERQAQRILKKALKKIKEASEKGGAGK